MRIKGAMTILNKRAEFYGTTVEELVGWLDENLGARINETIKVLQAYEVYKMDQGYYWHGADYKTWVKNGE